jgi:hypothetical protein
MQKIFQVVSYFNDPQYEVLTELLCNNTNKIYHTIVFIKKKIYFCTTIQRHDTTNSDHIFTPSLFDGRCFAVYFSALDIE